MGLMVDAIVSPVMFEEEDTGLVELAIEWKNEGKYPFICPSSDRANLMDRPGRAIRLTARYAIAHLFSKPYICSHNELLPSYPDCKR